MDAATLRRLLTPHERNALILLARYRGSYKDVAAGLRGGYERLDGRGVIHIVGRQGAFTETDVRALVESARAKIGRHRALMEARAARGQNGNGEGSEILDAAEDGPLISAVKADEGFGEREELES